MDLSCIISSGDLELYVLGLLPENEAQQIEQLMAIFPEVREEVDRISSNLEALANKSATTPGAEVKTRLFESLQHLNKEGGVANTSKMVDMKMPADSSEPLKEVSGDVSKIKRKPNYLAAASIAGLIIAAAAIVYLARQNSSHTREIASLQEAVSKQKEENLSYSNLLKVFLDENFQKINLEAVAGKPKALVNLLWNKSTKEVYVVDVSLPSPPANKQYQLWAIVNGQPVNAGMLLNKKQALQKMQSFDTADAFAITLEKEGGSESPTMEEMYVMGKAS